MVGGKGDANPGRGRGGAFANAGGKGTPVMFGAPKRPSQTTRYVSKFATQLLNTRSSADGSKYDWLTRDESKYDWLTRKRTKYDWLTHQVAASGAVSCEVERSGCK